MLRRLFFAGFCCACLTGTAAAQDLCPPGTPSDKLVCVIPHVYGVNGLVVANPAAAGDFQANFLSASLKPLDSAIAKQAALLPLASPSSGLTYAWNPETKTFASSTDSFGPIFGERAETIGKYKVQMALNYQHFKFNTIDGIDLKSLPVIFTQPDDSDSVPGRTCSIRGDNKDACAFIRDVIKTDNRLDLKINQYTTFVTFGLTNRIDVSMVIPMQDVKLSMISNATIIHNDNPTRIAHAFPTRTGCAAPCFTRVFSDARTVSGIGDITLRAKATAWKGERAGLAIGVDVRTPTGDALNFLGAGAAGVKPFLIWSYRQRISPHAVVGYEVNGSSVIAGDISTGTKERLPGQLTFTGGADVWINRSLTVVFDVVGQRVFESRRSSTTTFVGPGACDSISCNNPGPDYTATDLTQYTATHSVMNGSVGFKVKPTSTLLITGHVLLKLNDNGLRTGAIPMTALSYTF